MEENHKERQTVDQIEEIFGKHEGYRRAHARGSGYRGVFTGSGKAEGLTEAAHFQKGTVPVAVRFSHFSPDPTWADAMSPVKGMAVQFKIGSQDITNIVSVTSPVFFTRSPERFMEMLKVSRSFQKGRPKLAELAELLTDFPEVRAMFSSVKKMAVPESFATGKYHSIHAFYFKKEGRQQAVKYIFEPDTGEQKRSLKDMKDIPFGYYEHEFAERITHGPVSFKLYAILGQASDALDDPTREWPKERERLYLGQLTIKAHDAAAEQTLYDPTVMTKGIACTEDPILQFRRAAYRTSHERRTQEHKKGGPSS